MTYQTLEKVELSNGEGQPPTKFMSLDADRLYAGYEGNTNTVCEVQNTWYPFSHPSGGTITEWRNKNFTVAPDAVRFTYTGEGSRWFRMSAVCNVAKPVKGSASRTLEVVWHLNGAPSGIVREFHMSTLDSVVVSATGQLYLTAGDAIEPYVRNTENGEVVQFTNCTFDICEDTPVRL